MRVLSLCFLTAVAGRPTATASHILVKTAAECEKLKIDLSSGADFAELAREHSLCPSGKKGGDLGNFEQGRMVREFDKVVFHRYKRLGEVHGCVETKFGHHLIKVFRREGIRGVEEL
mmetsp:Transcript_66873/g.178378  ORF Transcript_66873/g.178378 Transcript_66873/m.178378 type:complete len:117 (+) Transcript_66873:87-437(+)